MADELRNDLTKFTVNLTPAARSALDKAAALHNDTRTDVTNRALMLYAAVAEITANHEGSYWVGYPDFDERGAVWLLVARERPKPW